MNHILNKTVCLVFVMSCLMSSCKELGAGSFPYAEVYNFDINKELLIEKISAFKDKYPEYKIIKIQSDEVIEEEKDYYFRKFYIAHFYLPDHNILMHCVIGRRPTDLSRIGLYAISDIDFSILKTINTSDLTKSENKEFKKIFEEEVLVPLRQFISHQE